MDIILKSIAIRMRFAVPIGGQSDRGETLQLLLGPEHSGQTVGQQISGVGFFFKNTHQCQWLTVRPRPKRLMLVLGLV